MDLWGSAWRWVSLKPSVSCELASEINLLMDTIDDPTPDPDQREHNNQEESAMDAAFVLQAAASTTSPASERPRLGKREELEKDLQLLQALESNQGGRWDGILRALHEHNRTEAAKRGEVWLSEQELEKQMQEARAGEHSCAHLHTLERSPTHSDPPCL